ncbi:MAG: reverse transcriptase domain-containing protein [Acidobacteriota bacterium]|nr:reverse transcriptase domain-containing protein [Acidobacteriota bacterium]
MHQRNHAKADPPSTLSSTTRVTRSHTRNASRHHFSFADDIVLIAENRKELQALLSRVEQAAAPFGLKINCAKGKTEAQNFAPVPDADLPITLGAATIATVTKYKYLGGWLEYGPSNDVYSRGGQAWQAIIKLDGVWRAPIPKALKLRLYRTLVESVLSYNADTWFLNTVVLQELRVLERRFLRKVLAVDYADHVDSFELYERAENHIPLAPRLRAKQLRLIGHILRRKNDADAAELLSDEDGYLTDVADTLGINPGEVYTAAQDREGWQKAVENAEQCMIAAEAAIIHNAEEKRLWSKGISGPVNEVHWNRAPPPPGPKYNGYDQWIREHLESCGMFIYTDGSCAADGTAGLGIHEDKPLSPQFPP